MVKGKEENEGEDDRCKLTYNVKGNKRQHSGECRAEIVCVDSATRLQSCFWMTTTKGTTILPYGIVGLLRNNFHRCEIASLYTFIIVFAAF